MSKGPGNVDQKDIFNDTSNDIIAGNDIILGLKWLFIVATLMKQILVILGVDHPCTKLGCFASLKLYC